MLDIFLESISQYNDIIEFNLNNIKFIPKNIVVPNNIVLVSKSTLLKRIEQEEQKREHLNEESREVISYNNPITNETKFVLCKVLYNPSFLSSCCNRSIIINGKSKNQSGSLYHKNEVLIQVQTTDDIFRAKKIQCYVNIFDILECDR